MEPGKLQRNETKITIYIYLGSSHSLAELRNRHRSIGLSSGTNHDILCFVHGLGQKSEQKP